MRIGNNYWTGSKLTCTHINILNRKSLQFQDCVWLQSKPKDGFMNFGKHKIKLEERIACLQFCFVLTITVQRRVDGHTPGALFRPLWV